MARDKDLYIEDENITKAEKLELDRYQKYLKSIKTYDPTDEEEYLYLTQELGHIINNNQKLSDIEMLQLTRKLEKIENTKDYTIELLELTREIKKITKSLKKELPKVDKKENPKKQSYKSLTATSLLPKIKYIPKENKERESKKEKPKIDEKLTFKGLVDKNIKNNPTVEHFNTERIQTIRASIENRPKPKKKESKTSKVFWSLMFVLSLCLLLFLIFRFIKWEIDNRLVESQIKDIYKDVNVVETVSSGAITDVSDLPIVEEEPNDGPVKVPQYIRPNDYWYYMSMSLLDVDFTELKKKNSDTAGWIQVNGTNINYPYVQTTNNEYYLKHSFDKSYNGAGWVFMDYRNNKEEYGRNTILYAHARLDNTMFGSLMGVVKPDWYNNSNNYVIKTSNEKSNALWQVFSVYIIEPESYYIRTKFNDEEFDKFLNTITSRSVHDFGVATTTEDKILTLSTCYFENKRVVLHAKLIRIEEK